MRLYSNLGNAAFRDLRLSLRGGLNSASQWADFDGDLDLDLLDGSGPVRNDGTTFVQLLPWAGEGHGASWADFDRDGDLDFVSTSRGLVQNDSGQFTNKVFAPDQVSNDSHALVGDFDANGFNDFLIL